MQPRIKPPFSVSILGASEHGKTRLVSQLLEAYRGQSSPRFVGGAECQFETPQRVYLLRHGERHGGVLQYLLFGPTCPDAAVLVVSAASGPTDELSEQLRLLRRLGVSSIVVVMSFVDLLNDEELLDSVEVDVRELLLREGFAGDETPFVRGGAREVVEVLERLMLIPRPQIDDFLLLIDERFGSSGQEMIAAGRVLRGSVQVGEPVSFYSIDGQTTAPVLGLDVVVRSQNNSSILDVGVIREKKVRATRGQWVACRFQKAHHRSLYDSYAIGKPNSLKTYGQAKALIWLEAAQTSSLLFRMRAEKGALRALFQGAPPSLEARRVLEIEAPPFGLGHVEAPAHFEIWAPRYEKAVGFGVFILLR